MELGRGVHTGTATNKSYGLLQLLSFSHVPMFLCNSEKVNKFSFNITVEGILKKEQPAFLVTEMQIFSFHQFELAC